jgi:hypothetical protein
MPLKLRASGLGSGIDKDRPDYIVSSGQWDVGRIYQVRGGPENMRWFWSMTVNGPMTRADRVATLEEAKAGVKKCCDEWKAWSKLEEAETELPVAADVVWSKEALWPELVGAQTPAHMTTLTLRRLRDDFLVTGPDIEPMKFRSRREAKDWCAKLYPGSPVTEIGANRSKRIVVAAKGRPRWRGE